MKVDSLKELKKLLTLCRQQGVQSIKLGEVEFHLGALPKKRSKAIDIDAFPEADIKIPQFQAIDKPIINPEVNQYVEDAIQTDELTEEQLMFYSAQGHQEQTN